MKQGESSIQTIQLIIEIHSFKSMEITYFQNRCAQVGFAAHGYFLLSEITTGKLEINIYPQLHFPKVALAVTTIGVGPLHTKTAADFL